MLARATGLAGKASVADFLAFRADERAREAAARKDETDGARRLPQGSSGTDNRPS